MKKQAKHESNTTAIPITKHDTSQYHRLLLPKRERYSHEIMRDFSCRADNPFA